MIIVDKKLFGVEFFIYRKKIMANKSWEQDFIDKYVEEVLCKNECIEIVNKGCRAKKYADLEYLDKSTKTLWRIEVKTSDSPGSLDSVHKIFGELLKNTSFKNTANSDYSVKYGLLLDSKRLRNKNDDFNKRNQNNFQKQIIRSFSHDRLQKFGEIVPIESVFIFDGENVHKLSWDDFISEEKIILPPTEE